MINTNPTTGIRYGVISSRSLDPTVFDDLFYSGTNLSEQEAHEDLRAEVKAEADAIEEECRIALHERDPLMGDQDFDYLLEAEIEAAYEHRGYANREDFIDTECERRGEFMEIEEPTIEGESDGVKYRISWLGGAPLLWVIEGPLGYANRLCSPCVPNAADLDGGFIPGNADDPQTTMTEGYLCYVVPRDWLATEA